MYHHWGCTLIYQLLSYPFRSLVQNNKTVLMLQYMQIKLYSLGKLNKLKKSFYLLLIIVYAFIKVTGCLSDSGSPLKGGF